LNYILKVKLVFILLLTYLSIPFVILAFSYSPTATNNFSFEVLLDEKIEGSLKRPGIGEEFYVISDEDENFYLPTIRGFNKYDKNGDLVFKIERGFLEYGQLSNLVLVNDKVIVLTNKWPGFVNVFDKNTGEELAHVRVMQGDPSAFIPTYPFSEINYADNFVFFSSHRPPFVYRFNVNDYSLDSYDYKEHYGVTEMYNFSPPVVVDGNKVLFTSYKGELQLFDINNIAIPVFFKSFNKENNFLYHDVSVSQVPTTYGDNNFFTIYRDYLCVYEKVGGDNIDCKDYTDINESELYVVGNNAVSVGNNVFFLIKRIKNSVSSYFLSKYSTSFVREFFTNLGSNAHKGGLTKDLQQNILVTGDKVFNISSANGEVLGAFDMQDSKNKIYVSRVSKVSPTSRGNFYVLAIKHDYSKNREFSQIYKFKGVDGVIPDCELGFYCDSTPKFRPVILIHGLGGNYQSWFDSKNAIVRQAILQKYQAEDPEFPDDWVYAYSYGYNFGGDYNYQGKVEDISTNLHFDVDRLAAQNKLAGGDGKVDIVAYSLGGLIARHYLLEKTGFPGEQNLNVDHKVGKLILVASPVNGSSGLQSIDDFDAKYGQSGVKLKDILNEGLTKYQGHLIDLNKDIGLQLGSSSEYIVSIRGSSVPKDISYYRSYADFIISSDMNIFGRVVSKKIDLGDIVVLPKDTELGTPFKDSKLITREYSVEANIKPKDGYIDIGIDKLDISSLYHDKFISNPENINNLIYFLQNE